VESAPAIESKIELLANLINWDVHCAVRTRCFNFVVAQTEEFLVSPSHLALGNLAEVPVAYKL
jgi:hypothetical protein